MKRHLFILALIPALLGADSALEMPIEASPEAGLVRGISDLREARSEDALGRLDTVLKDKPAFQLARLVRGDLLMVRGGILQKFSNALPAAKVDPLRQEAKARVARYVDSVWKKGVPSYFLEYPADVKSAVLVDVKRSRLFYYKRENGTWRLDSDWYTSTGRLTGQKKVEGDERTPLGVYTVQPPIPKAKLTDFYGSGAFPLDYPTAWDRLNGRGGYGIWIHGSPISTYSRPPRASGGCVVLTNPDFEALGKKLEPGKTPVVVADGAQWVDPSVLDRNRRDLLESVESWRKAWESRDVDRYLAWYGASFRSGSGQSLSEWETQKRKVNSGKSWITVKLASLSAVVVPEAQPLVQVEFQQDYRSNNLENNMRKRQYWKREEGHWRIVYEGDPDGKR
jgi:murein L,D-transpeptidase YafK